MSISPAGLISIHPDSQSRSTPFEREQSEKENIMEQVDEKKTESMIIPEGIPKSGRVWKKKQTTRTSTMKRQGVLAHLASPFEKRKLLETKSKQVKEYEKELREQTRMKKVNERIRREEKQKRRMENEYKTVVVQQVSFKEFNTHQILMSIFSFL
jgi:predicted ribosome quality control (RQC) complex YloA/Tae2 family protein